jgi:hypothetical protein
MASKGTAKRAPAEFRGRVYDSIVETIGATPLVRIHRLARDTATKADILGGCRTRSRRATGHGRQDDCRRAARFWRALFVDGLV